MAATFRRRFESFVLRWQARLDSEWADRVVPWITASALFLFLLLLALAKARSLEGTPDLAGYSQAAWLIGEGRAPIVTVTTGTHVMAQQAAFIFYPIVLLTWIVPIEGALLTVQSAALALAVIPLWKICRRLASLRTGATGTVLFVYAFYPVMHNLNLAGFHPETIGLPALLAAMYFGLSDRWRLFALACTVAVLSRADLGLAVAGLGALLVVEGKRRPGAITLVTGSAWTVLAVTVIQPAFGGESYPHVNAFSQFGDTPWTVAWGMITHPGTVVADLVSEQNFRLLVTLLAPVLFLPVLAHRYLLPVLPLQFLYMVARVPSEAVFGQQTVAVTAFMFLSSAFALRRIGRTGVEKVTVDRRVLAVLLLAGTVFFIQDGASSPYRRPWDWGGRDIVDFSRIQIAHQIPPDKAVRASPSMLQLLEERPVLYTLAATDRPDAIAAAEGVDVVVLDGRQVGEWTAVELQVFRSQLQSLGFDRQVDDQGIELFVRGSALDGR